MSSSQPPGGLGYGSLPGRTVAEPQIVYVPVPAPRSLLASIFTWAIRSLFLLSLVINVVVLWLVFSVNVDGRLPERHYSGSLTAGQKIALVHIDGVIMEGMIDFACKQLKTAALDSDVAAVVVAVNSPGGSVTASDLLYQQVKDLRDGKWPGQTRPKPVVVAMESVAASGGYYLSMPALRILAQPTTITGSIGVYAQLINIRKLAEQYGVEATLLKKGELKGSGSLFKALTPDEQREFDDLLEHSYQRFMTIVKEGRGNRLKYGLRDEIKVQSRSDPKVTYVRRLADGGAYTADEALAFGLIDQIGYVNDALEEAKKLAGGDPAAYRVVTFQQPLSLMDALIGSKTSETASQTLDQIPGLTARLWFMTPGFELAGVRIPTR